LVMPVRRLRALLLASGAVVLLPGSAAAIDIAVSNDATLRAAITGANSGDRIVFQSNITLSADLPLVQTNVTIVGNGNSLSGNGGASGVSLGGSGGFGGGSGGGGLGAGGGIFVQQGGNLTLGGPLTVNGNSVTGGTGGGAAGSGSALGAGLFLQGNGALTLSPGAGQHRSGRCARRLRQV